MKKTIDIEAILAPLPGDNPAGENLRYEPVYDEIKEARRADDTMDRGDWQRELKISDWDKVIKLSSEILTEKSKDLQIAAWLLEALAEKDGFEGVYVGLQIVRRLLEEYWEHLYPEIEDDDLDYRIGPLEFLNGRLMESLKRIAVTDPGVSPGYTWFQWEETQRFAGIADDYDGQKARQELIAGGKTPPDEFDSAVMKSAVTFYENLYEDVNSCIAEFEEFDKVLDEKFGKEAPRVSDISSALQDCHRLVKRIFKDKGGLESVEVEADSDDETVEETLEGVAAEAGENSDPGVQAAGVTAATADLIGGYKVRRMLDSGTSMDLLWQSALKKMKETDLENALDFLLGAACSAQSIREKTNCRLLIVKLCIRAGKAQIAKPIAEEIHTLMDELQLARWESPAWVAEVIDSLYQCLTAPDATEDDIYRAQNELRKKICTIDVTKALKYS